MENNSDDIRWYEKNWVIVLALLFACPIGLFLLWRCQRASLKLKCIVTAIIILIVVFPSTSKTPKDKKVVERNKQSVTQSIPEITKSEAKAKLDEMSKGLSVYYDDMKGFTICYCDYTRDYKSQIVPGVIVLDDFTVSLYYHVLYSGREPLRFDTLYVKTVDGVKSFKFDKVSTLYGHVVVEEYKGNMSGEVYKTLKTAVSTGYAKIRLEGRQMDERELTQEELSEYAKVFSIYEYFSNVKVK